MTGADTEIPSFETDAGPLTVVTPVWTPKALATTMIRHLFSGGAVIGGEIKDLARVLGGSRQGLAICGQARDNGRAAARSAIEALEQEGRLLARESRLFVVIAAPALAEIEEATYAVAEGCHPRTAVAFGGPDAQVCLVAPNGT